QSGHAELSRRVSELETRLEDARSVETMLGQTLEQARDSSAKAVEHARKEAQLIILDAEQRAAHILDKSKNDLMSLREQVTILGAKKASIVSRLKMLLHSELELVRALDAGDDPGEASDGSEDAVAGDKRDSSEIDDIVKSLDDR
ncbi:MAG TPA: DivIVA domain-containing protein, partial [Bacteroidota bacterium]|nr:DivIVA domain-containing protein [Bacteroidota bacterium]